MYVKKSGAVASQVDNTTASLSRSFGRRTALLGASASLMAATPRNASAQSWPSRPIRIVAGFPPGNSTDLLARVLSDNLRVALGQPVIVENRPGAGGTIGTEHVARSAPDGYTLGLSNAGPLTIAPSLYRNLTYDPVRDFTQIASIALSPHLFVVRPDFPARNLQEFIAYLKAHPDEVFYGTSGSGSTQHLVVELFQSITGTRLTHVPYRGSSQVLSDLLNGQVRFASDTLIATMEQVKAGRLRALAVTSLQRSSFMPDVPTLDEQGVTGFDFFGWIGVLAPAGLPDAIASRLEREIQAAIVHPEFTRRMEEFALSPFVKNRQDMQAFIAADLEKYRRIIQAAGIRLD